MCEPQLHMISNGKQSMQTLAVVAAAAAPYVDFVHLREKRFTARDTAEALNLLKTVLSPQKLAVNDRLDAALACGVERIHLAWHSLSVQDVKRTFPDITAGKSVHSLREAQEAERRGADYIMYGHIYTTDCKPGLPPRGLETLERICEKVRIPVIAVGGIRPSNVKEILQAGAAGVAVMSGIADADDPAAAAREYARALKEA